MNRILALQRMRVIKNGAGQLMESKTSCLDHSCSMNHNY